MQHVNHECPTNRYERHLYPLLQGGKGMPRLWAAGVQGEWDYLAIDLLGPSLDNLFRKSGKDAMDLRSVCSIAMQVVRPFFGGLSGGVGVLMRVALIRLHDWSSCMHVGCCTVISSWVIALWVYPRTRRQCT